eukprot:scaffold27037_cov57-Phaeocystis_antarctica.AAC.1
MRRHRHVVRQHGAEGSTDQHIGRGAIGGRVGHGDALGWHALAPYQLLDDERRVLGAEFGHRRLAQRCARTCGNVLVLQRVEVTLGLYRHKERRGAFDRARHSGAVLTLRRREAAGQVTAPRKCCRPRRLSVPQALGVPPAPQRKLPAVEQSGGRIPAKQARLVRPRRALVAAGCATAQRAA